jgi:outer membrane protein insertion porin family
MRNVLLAILLCWTALNLKAQQTVDYSAPATYTIGGIEVVGANVLDKTALISISGLSVGQQVKVPGEEITAAVRKLWKQGILGDVRVEVAEFKGTQVFLRIVLAERPRLSRYTFVDVPKGQHETLSEKITLVRGKIVTDAMLKNARRALEKHYQEKGFRDVQVRLVPQRDSLMANSVALNIFIDKKSRVKIDEITFVGLEEMPEKKIRRKLKKTKQKRFGRIFSPSKMIDSKYEEDKKNLVSFYSAQGYRNMEIVEDSIRRNDDGTVSIYMRVEEGRRFYHRNISWVGNYVYPDSVLAQVLGIARGDVYNPEELSKRVSFNPTGTDVYSLYMDNGYLFFNLEPVEIAVEGDSVDLEMRIYEGEQAEIRQINVSGNTKTSDHVIYREIRTIPGQKFSRSDLIRTQRELSTLGYFDPEQIGITPTPNMNDGTVDINYTLVERPSDQIELSGGWGGVFGFVGTLGVVFNNFSVRKIGRLKEWKPLPSGDGQRLAVRLQANGRQFQTYSLTFTEPWLGGRQPNSFSVNLSHSVQRLIDFGSTNTVTGGLNVTGISVSLGRRLKFPDDFFTMSNSLGFLQYTLDRYRVRGFSNYDTGRSYNFTFNTTIARNSIDNPTYPRSGSSISLSATLTPPYSLFSTTSFGELTSENRFKWVEYHKWMFDNAWYTSLVGKLVMSARVHMGFIGTYNKDKGLGPFERFLVGGDGLAQNNFLLGTDIVGLRGYQNNSISPYVFDPTTNAYGNNLGGTIYNKYVLELRYPISLNPSATIYMLAFMEGGNNWGTFRDFNPFNLYRSVGVGARIFMPAFGLLGVDYGIGFDEVIGAPGSNGGQFHFTIGQQFR